MCLSELQAGLNVGQVDPLAAHYISPIDEDSYTLLH